MIGHEIIVKGDAGPLKELAKLENLDGLNERVGQRVQEAVQDFYFRLDGERANRMGGKRSHFYHFAGASATYKTIHNGAVVTVDKVGLAQRIYGGTIRAVNAKNLAIPARAESYGVPPKEFPGDLQFIQFRSGAKALVKDEQTHTVDADSGSAVTRSTEKGQRKAKGAKRKGIGMVMYWLVPSVYQSPDPSAMPSKEYILRAVDTAVGEHYQKTTTNN